MTALSKTQHLIQEYYILNIFQQFITVHTMMPINQKVVEVLSQTIDQSPHTTQLDLQFMEITDLVPYMQYLAQLTQLTKLSLFGNRLKQLPVNMQCLGQLQELDLANNMLDKTDIEINIQSLRTLPHLRKLSYPIIKQKQQVLLDNLPQLEILNNVKTHRNQQTAGYSPKYMTNNKLAQINQELQGYFEKILEFQNTYLDDVDNEVSSQAFNQENRQTIEDHLKIYKSHIRSSETADQAVYRMTQYQLYSNLKNRAFKICVDIYGDLGKFIVNIAEIQDQMFKDMGSKYLQMTTNSSDSLRKTDAIMTPISEKNNNATLQKQLKRMRKHKDQLLSEINQLQSENKHYLQTLVKYSRGDKNAMMNFGSLSGNTTRVISSLNQNIMKLPQKSHRTPIHPTVPSHNVTNNFSNYTTQNYSSTGSRVVTLKQLKDTIEQIYESKLKFDQKNFDGKIPRQTMHQYLFTYLNQKYGLKNLTIETANGIISGIQTYSSEDNDVAVFGKILRNQIDQQFRNVQSELKSTINNLLKMHIKSQHPYKSASQIQDIFNQKTGGQVTIDEASDIVRYLYNKNDADNIMKKLEMLFKLNKPKEQHVSKRRLKQENHEGKSKLKLKFSIFLKTVLDFQLKNHQKLLKPLVRIFKMQDQDSDGIVNEQEFIYIIEELCEEANNILPDLLMIVDPYETKIITFTEVVKLVANYPQNNPILSRFLQANQDELD